MVCVLLIIVGVGSHHRQPQAVCGGWLESASGVNHLYQLFIELLVLYQFFQSEMHTISPVMSWIGRYVDTFRVHIGIADFFVY